MAPELAVLIEEIETGLWNWSVWVDSEPLEVIEEVVYTLDSSFFNPVRRTKERESRFKMGDIASGPFTVFASLKLASGVEVKLEKRLELISAKDEGSRPKRRPIILAVEDDANVLEAVVRDLRRRYGGSYRLLRAGGGQEGLEKLQKLKDLGEDVALILSDQRMPEMRGTRFLTLAKRYFPSAKIALLTAYLDSDVALEAINVCKVDYYLGKPWDPPEERLYPVVDELLNAWLPMRGSRFRE